MQKHTFEPTHCSWSFLTYIQGLHHLIPMSCPLLSNTEKSGQSAMPTV